jgi:hypothetical protein
MHVAWPDADSPTMTPADGQPPPFWTMTFISALQWPHLAAWPAVSGVRRLTPIGMAAIARPACDRSHLRGTVARWRRELRSAGILLASRAVSASGAAAHLGRPLKIMKGFGVEKG